MSYSAGHVVFKCSFDTHALQFLDIFSISMTLPVVIETAATTPLREENPLLCHVPSIEILISLPSVALVSVIASIMLVFATFSIATLFLIYYRNCVGI